MLKPTGGAQVISIKWILGAILLGVALVVALAIAIGVWLENPRLFFHEGSVLTWVSFFQLVMVAAFSWQIYKLQEVSSQEFDWKEPGSIWAIIAAGFLFLALDEVVKIHEALDKLIHIILRMEETELTDRIDDVIIVVYGLIGIGALYKYRQGLMKHKHILPFILFGFFFLFLMVVCDIMTSQNDILPGDRWVLRFMLAEDSIKLFAEAIFMVGFYHGLRQARAQVGAST